MHNRFTETFCFYVAFKLFLEMKSFKYSVCAIDISKLELKSPQHINA